MNKAVSYIKTITLSLLGLLVLFAGIGAILVVLGQATWAELGDWTLKAAIIAVVVLAINAVGALIVGVARKDS